MNVGDYLVLGHAIDLLFFIFFIFHFERSTKIGELIRTYFSYFSAIFGMKSVHDLMHPLPQVAGKRGVTAWAHDCRKIPSPDRPPFNTME